MQRLFKLHLVAALELLNCLLLVIQTYAVDLVIVPGLLVGLQLILDVNVGLINFLEDRLEHGWLSIGGGLLLWLEWPSLRGGRVALPFRCLCRHQVRLLGLARGRQGSLCLLFLRFRLAHLLVEPVGGLLCLGHPRSFSWHRSAQDRRRGAKLGPLPVPVVPLEHVLVVVCHHRPGEVGAQQHGVGATNWLARPLAGPESRLRMHLRLPYQLLLTYFVVDFTGSCRCDPERVVLALLHILFYIVLYVLYMAAALSLSLECRAELLI